MTNAYNGYSGTQRDRKLRALHKLKVEGRDLTPAVACMLCGDADVPVALHSEDYSEPFRWEPPHCYAVCTSCHWQIHQRFARPEMWAEFVKHVRRGGYAGEYRHRKTILIPPDRPRPKHSDWWLKLSTKP